MTTVATAPRRAALACLEPEPGGATLADRIAILWSELVEEGTAECPVCGSEMSAAQACNDCGSELS